MVTVSGKLCQFFAVITGTLTVISDGFHFGWSSPIVPLLKSSESPIAIDDSDIVLLESYTMYGGLAGLLLTIVLLDKIGRKKTMLLAAIENLISWILISTATSTKILFLARFIGGIAADVNFVAAPVYIAEIAEKSVRGRLGSLINVFNLLGIISIYSIGPLVPIAVSSAFPICLLIIELLTFSSMPESPYYLLMCQKNEAARKSLQTFRNGNVNEELEELSKIVEKQNSARGRPLDLFTVKSNRKAIFIMAVLNYAQNFTGLPVLIMNLHLILEESGITFATNSAAIAFATLMFISSSVSTLLIDLVGRRVLLYTSSFFAAITMFVLGAYFLVKNTGVDITAYTWVPVVSLLIYAIVHRIGLSFVPIVVTAELFPTNVKAFGCTAADGMYITSCALAIYLFHYLYRKFGMHVPFFMFGLCAVLAGFFAIFILPETKGKSLEEIQETLKGEDSQNLETAKLLSSREKLNSYSTVQAEN